MINPNLLKSFVTLCETKHFTLAAEQCHMTQSGLSQHIKKLESQLNVELIHRHAKRFELTPAGERLLEQAQHILGCLTELPEQIREDEPYRGTVKIMSPGSVGLKLYPVLLTLQQSHPELVIEYRFAPNKDIAEAVKTKQIDIGLTSEQVDQHVLTYDPLASEPLLLVTPEFITAPSWDALSTIGFIHHPDGAYHGNLLLGANYPEFQHVNQLPNRGFSNQIGLILEPVSRGLGFTVLPAHAVSAFSPAEKIRQHTLTHPIWEPLFICQGKHQPYTKAVNTVKKAIKEVLS
ncbi:LysR family transcriptional regulator [Rhodanobacter aciditrophus]|uniref:LysR family transcriptional regulator n=1 Tax=Rhodanobacter aciditrophus TaxID=1623218 RepID=A0ABW4B2W9_9GAMM